MLWYKAWLETRWRFVIGLVILMCSAIGIVMFYPRAMRLIAALPAGDLGGGRLGDLIRENALLSREYRGYIWTQWWRQQIVQTGTLFAVLLGSGSVVAWGTGARAFMLSLPVSRGRLIGTRAAAGLLELLVLLLASALTLTLVSPAVGETYGVGATLAHVVCAFLAGAVFFSLAMLLSTVFNDMWRPLLITIGVAVALNALEQILHVFSIYGIFSLMSAETYFRNGTLPWLGLAASAAASAAMVYGAAINFARQDF